MNPTILYILGAGNSGSTLLSMVLGGHSKVASLGELVAMDRWHADGELCSCGSLLEDCERWGPILAMRGTHIPMPIAPLPRRPGLLSRNAQRMREDVHAMRTIKRNIELYGEIARATGRKYLVDASKNSLHFYYLRACGYYRIVPIVLVRKGEGYVRSASRRGRSTTDAMMRWVKDNILVERVIRETNLGTKVVRVRYEDLVLNPESVLMSICGAVGLQYEPKMLEYYEQPHHNIAGTDSRFQPRPIDPSVGELTKLSLSKRLMFKLLGGSIWNRFFGAH